MPKQIFVGLPVENVASSTSFYEAIGAVKNLQFSDSTAACMVFSETISAMLMSHDRFRSFTPKAIADARTSSEVLISISFDSREEVDSTVAKAVEAGGIGDPSPIDDHGFMYGRSFEDPDGHLWGVMWMDVEAVKVAMAQGTVADGS